MDSVLRFFHLDIHTFSELLMATGGIVAGSAALAAYTNTSFQPNDLDIWVHSDFFPPPPTGLLSPTPVSPDHPGVAVRHAYQYIFNYFLKQHGYHEVHRPVQSDEEYTSNPVFAILRNIQRFQHPSGRVIQVMHCKVPVDDILDTFDLSAALTWWVPSLHPAFRQGFLHSINDAALKAGVMYSLRPTTTDREGERIQKYEARGFRLVPRDEVQLHILTAAADAADAEMN